MALAMTFVDAGLDVRAMTASATSLTAKSNVGANACVVQVTLYGAGDVGGDRSGVAGAEPTNRFWCRTVWPVTRREQRSAVVRVGDQRTVGRRVRC